jgi:hypothetical protein
LAAPALAGSPAIGATREPDPLTSTQAGVTVDWMAGTLSAGGGAAADLRMPSVDLARPGAERRARAAAEAKLRTALATLPLGGGQALKAGEIDRAVGRAQAVDVQYQSNGGAVVRLEVPFGGWVEDPAAGAGTPPVATLAVHAMRLAAAPAAKVGGREVRLGAAIYRVGAAPAAANALPAKVERGDRLVLAADADLASKLARGVVLIYVQKVVK